jgi:hypothetical protein
MASPIFIMGGPAQGSWGAHCAGPDHNSDPTAIAIRITWNHWVRFAGTSDPDLGLGAGGKIGAALCLADKSKRIL